ncbi:uncharacterized protein LOC120294787 [Eucalyptus grandis]|uniref:uncharacterized protein LOC120294787 n=1 Tax=Eucalyptus grandis TaxID=71139 RepID=UPI00192EA207|nr:uncharacterized protein LOC120294787 [Eucalyptus grandis]
MGCRSERGLSVGAPARFGSNQTCSKTEEAADGSVRACSSKQRSSNVGCRDVGLLGLIQVEAEHQWRAPGGTVMVRQRWRLTGVWQLDSDVAGQQWIRRLRGTPVRGRRASGRRAARVGRASGEVSSAGLPGFGAASDVAETTEQGSCLGGTQISTGAASSGEVRVWRASADGGTARRQRATGVRRHGLRLQAVSAR